MSSSMRSRVSALLTLCSRSVCCGRSRWGGAARRLLDDDEFVRGCGVHLNTITGAQLYASVFVPDTFGIDELNTRGTRATTEMERYQHEMESMDTGNVALFATRRAGVPG